MLFALLAGVCLTLAQEAQVAQPPPPITFADWKVVDRTADQIEYIVSFPSAYTTPYPENDIVPIRILIPADTTGPVPAVILMHYWGAQDLKVERSLGAELNRRGIAAILLTLPYHLARTPKGFDSGDLAVRPEPQLLIANMTQSIWDVRRTIDWMATRPEFDHARTGVSGTSLGALVATIAFGVEQRITHAAFVLGGADIAHIIWNSSRVVKQREALRKKGYYEGRLRAEISSIEPLTYLKNRQDGRAFVIGAKYDTVVPGSSTNELIAALHDPKVLWVETGHYGGIFVQRRLLREVASFFAAEFNAKEYIPPKRINAPTLRLGAILTTASGFDLAAGLDLLRLDRHGDGFVSFLVTPRGPQLFIGRKIDSRISMGFTATKKRVGVGLFWSTVL